MDTFFQTLAAISGPIAGILAYMLIEGKRKAKTRAKADNEPAWKCRKCGVATI